MAFCIAISGYKNSGKTTLIENIIPILSEHNLNVAVVKHDGHDYTPDVPGTDSFRHFNSGAYGTAVFSDTKFSVTKRCSNLSLDMLCAYFDDADIILCEGFKFEPIPKLFILSENNPIVDNEHVVAWIIDDSLNSKTIVQNINVENKPVFSRNDYKSISEFILKLLPHFTAE